MVIPIDVRLTLVGDEALLRTFKRLNDNMQRKIATRALRVGSRPLLQKMKDRARSISNPATPTTTMRRVANALKMRVQKRSRVRKGMRIFVDTSKLPGEEHIPFTVETGSRKNKAQSFMRAVVDEEKERTLKRIGVEIGRGVDAVWRRTN